MQLVAQVGVLLPSIRQSLVASLSRRYPLYSGCAGIANSRALRRLAGDSEELVWSRVPGGEVLASLDDYVGRSAFYVGDLDRKITWICKRIVRPGDVILDIGANIGMVTVWLSKLVGPTGLVHAFEPNPLLCDRLLAALERMGRSNVQLHRFALGCSEGELSLCIPNGNAGEASLVVHRDPARSKTISVPVRRLADVAIREGIQNIRLVKLDVELFEAEVLEGARALLEHSPPESILFEMNGEIGGVVGDEPVFRILKEHNYAFFFVPRRRIWMRLETFDPDAVRQLKGHDVFAIARGGSFDSMVRAVRAVV
jgi:FkbM family methyltransferase